MNADRIRWAEKVLGTLGILLLGIYGFLYLDGSIESRAALEAFRTESAQLTTSGQSEPAESRPTDTVDKLTPTVPRRPGVPIEVLPPKLVSRGNSAIAELRVPRFGLDVPVFSGTSWISLNHGAGWIGGTAGLSSREGTTGIAGHRDRFFRSLQNINRGDEIVLSTREQVQTFIVDRIAIVAPSNVTVLRKQTRRSLVLVTCYPFSYIGPAPKRFIVGAQLKSEVEIDQPSGVEQQVAPERARSLF